MDADTPGLGLRVTQGGARAYIFESRLFGKTIRKVIGDPKTIGLKDARSLASKFKAMVLQGKDPREELRSRRASHESRREAAQFTLSRLCEDYCNHLESLGRMSHREARSIFKLHVNEAWPKIAALPAREITDEHVADMMRKLIEDGKGRTSNKLRSYLHAAYHIAKAAKSDPKIPVAIKSFGVTSNPVSDTAPDLTKNKTDKRPLNADEMRIYWRLIRDAQGFKPAVLRLHLLTGSQRIAQLVRLKTNDIQEHDITIHDGKGRPGQNARPHTIPLTKTAAEALADCNPPADSGLFAITTDGGKTHLAATTLTKWAKEVVGDKIEDFSAKRLRSGVETMLSKAKVSKEIRGHLQSHGIAGVQARHYDGNEYMDEKREALQTLYRLLESSDAVSGG